MAVTKYIYDGDRVLEETNDAGVTQKTYTWNPDGYGDLLSVFDGTNAKYYEPDGLGSTDALVNQAQTVTDRWRYRAFGAATRTAGATVNPFTWVGRQGYYSDSQTGLYLLGSGTRYYDPATAHFLSRDPVDLAGGDTNLYRYVSNNPVNKMDPNGLGAPAIAAGVLALLGACAVEAYAEVMIDWNNGGWVNDLWAHCVTSCRIARRCGGTGWAILAGVVKEIGDEIISDGFSLRDMVGNFHGLDCAGIENMLGSPIAGWIGAIVRDSCESCCDGYYDRNQKIIRRNPPMMGVAVTRRLVEVE